MKSICMRPFRTTNTGPALRCRAARRSQPSRRPREQMAFNTARESENTPVDVEGSSQVRNRALHASDRPDGIASATRVRFADSPGVAGSENLEIVQAWLG